MRRETLPRIGFSVVLSAALLACATSCSPEARMARAEKTDISTAKNREDAARYVYGNELARTPPMGWNSWNAFRGNISEEQIEGIVDAMVTSGLRDAGYTYLVIDDGWMANRRDSEGRLIADPNKFPSGMRILSDYVHSRGLKFGLYEDRGHSTCMKLPGSFRHEQADMDTFAEWGVDYIKLDSCYAEINGRKSSDDFGLFKECIIKTGRPMILSMANYTDPSWAWGGQDIGHLWRTSYDIQPRMSSVYSCADTSAGDIVIHPAFNGLWQFAGPGHWNDPDMLEVGNLKSDIENKAHFSLWCILAAPLIAGNDFRNMSEATRDILTAKEPIQVNQDPRGVQGYKVHDDGDHEIYNKPLSDGRTAVLLLNKGASNADITVTWDKIGLRGRQMVRDLWQRKNLGYYSKSFTAKNLPQHGHMFLIIGSKGKPLAMPDSVPLEKYSVTRKGKTYLSDLYYVWRAGSAPEYDKTVEGKPIMMNGTLYKKGLGCRATSKIMFKLNGYAARFRAVIGFDPSYQGNETVNFRLRNEDPIGPDSLLYDSGKMAKDTPAKVVDIDVRGIDCLILSIEGKQALCNWADAHVVTSP